MGIRVRKRLIWAKLVNAYNLQNYAKVKDFNFLSIKAYSVGKIKSPHISAFVLLGARTNLRELFCWTLSNSEGIILLNPRKPMKTLRDYFRVLQTQWTSISNNLPSFPVGCYPGNPLVVPHCSSLGVLEWRASLQSWDSSQVPDPLQEIALLSRE